LCIAIVWLPSVLLGVLGVIDFPNLKGGAASSVLARMIELYAPGALAGFLAAGVLSAIMNSMDSQTLAVGTMFTHDIVHHYGFKDKMTEQQQVWFGRLFIVLIIAVTFLLSLVVNRSIFRIGVWAFTGFAAMFPVVVGAVFWKRSTKYGALAAVCSVVVLWLYFFLNNIENVGGGLMPVAIILAVATVAMIVGSLLTAPPPPEILEKFFPAGTAQTAERVARATIAVK